MGNLTMLMMLMTELDRPVVWLTERAIYDIRIWYYNIASPYEHH